MSKLSSLVNDIIASGLNTSGKEWLEIVQIINSKPEEYLINYLGRRRS